jgi:hypothetical protein
MGHRSSSRFWVIMLVIIIVSLIIATAIYIYKQNSSTNQIITQLPLPIKVKVIKIPDVNTALTALFSLATRNNQLKINQETLASLWFEQSFNDGINQYHVIFIKNQMVDAETDEVYGSHADAPIISAVVYRLTDDEWQLVSKQKNIGNFGSWGNTPTIKKAPLFLLAKGNATLLLAISYSGQGYTNSGKTIFSYYQNRWTQLGYLQTEGDNSGVCDDETKADELLSACWSFTGETSLAEENNVTNYPNISVKRTGTMAGATGKIIPVTDSLYRFNGEKYIEVRQPNHEASNPIT